MAGREVGSRERYPPAAFPTGIGSGPSRSCSPWPGWPPRPTSCSSGPRRRRDRHPDGFPYSRLRARGRRRAGRRAMALRYPRPRPRAGGNLPAALPTERSGHRLRARLALYHVPRHQRRRPDRNALDHTNDVGNRGGDAPLPRPSGRRDLAVRRGPGARVRQPALSPGLPHLGFDVEDYDGDGAPEILVIAHHMPEWPCQVALLDAAGKIEGEY